jgi:sigma-E factor negative regulatory protein RseB
VRRRAVIASGTAGLAIIGAFIAGSAGSPSAPLRPATQTAKLARTGMAAKLAGTRAAAAGVRLLGEAATAARTIPYHAVQVVSWLAPGSRTGWLSPAAGRVRVDLWHRTGQPPDVMLGLSASLVGLLDAHYVVVYTGQGSAAGRAASVVEVRRRNGSVAARFWLDDATKLPLRREIFDSHAHLISVAGLAGLKLATGSTAGARSASDRAGPAENALSAWPRTATSQQRTVASHAVNNAFAEISMAGLVRLPAAPASPAARAPASPAARAPAAAGHIARSPAAAASPARVPSAPPRPWADRLGQAQLTALRTSGWPVPVALPGGLALFGASESGPRPGRVVDAAYSDGLSVVSLFLQRGQLPTVLPGWRQTDLDGHLVYLRNPAEPDLAWSAGGYVYTVVADAPAAVIAGVVNSLPHQGRPGFWARMDRGMRRVFSWINPFR